MSSAAFHSLQRTLERLAEAPRRLAPASQSPLQMTLDGLTVVYELNDEERTLTVLHIHRTDSA